MKKELAHRHWGARLKSGVQKCSVCEADPVSYLVTVDDDDVVIEIEWFCGLHQPESPKAL